YPRGYSLANGIHSARSATARSGPGAPSPRRARAIACEGRRFRARPSNSHRGETHELSHRIWTLSATEALARFRTKELSPVEYLEALIGRITAEDERINAVTEVVEEAVTSAREAERFYANAAADDLAEAAVTRPL